MTQQFRVYSTTASTCSKIFLQPICFIGPRKEFLPSLNTSMGDFYLGNVISGLQYVYHGLAHLEVYNFAAIVYNPSLKCLDGLLRGRVVEMCEQDVTSSSNDPSAN